MKAFSRVILILAAAAPIWLFVEPALSFAEASTSLAPDLTDANAVRDVVKPFIEREREGFRIPGAAFVLVCNGRVTICDGFGNGDVARGTPVDPERTIFAVGSLSKVVTAIAILQLAEAGKLDLNADINTYLATGRAPFRIPDNYLLPVTAARLLTHTSGMEDPHIGIAARETAHLIPLPDYLAANLPRRVIPPDTIAGYCNDGFTLLGYLVELISGTSFDAYADAHIFQPLGMTRTSFHQPAPSPADRATGYDLRGEKLLPTGEFYVHNVPAAAMTTTAADIGRLLIALLDDSKDKPGARILSPAMTAAMLITRFRNDSRASGWTYGLHGATEDGERRIEHGGLSIGFTAKIVLLPDRHAGFFAVYNRCIQSVLPELDVLFAVVGPTLPAAPAGVPDDFERFIGAYRASLHARHSVERLAPMVQSMSVSVENRKLILRDGSTVIPLRCVGPGSFLRGDDIPGPAVFFRQDGAGLPHMIYGGDDFEQIPWYSTREAQLFAVILIAGVFVIHCFVRPLAGRWSSRLSRLASLTALSFLIALGIYVSRMDQMDFLYGIPRGMKILLAVPWLVAILASGFGVSLFRYKRDRRTWPARRLHAGALLGTFAAFFALLIHWRLVLPFSN